MTAPILSVFSAENQNIARRDCVDYLTGEEKFVADVILLITLTLNSFTAIKTLTGLWRCDRATIELLNIYRRIIT